MNTLNVTVAHTGNNYCAMIDGVDNIMVTGNSIDEIKANLVSAIEDTKSVCQESGIPTVVWFSPLLPFINDTKENIEGIVDLCAQAGVRSIICFGIGVTMREGNREYFYDALDRLAARDSKFIGMKDRYQKTYGYTYALNSAHNNELMSHLAKLCHEHHIQLGTDDVFKWMEEFPDKDPYQPELF